MTLSRYSKAVVALVGSVAAALVGAIPDSAAGKWAAVVLAVMTALGVAKTSNTQTVETGEGDEPATIGTVVSDTGAVVGSVVADTGTATGGIVAGTTGVVGGILDATVGKLLPGGRG